MSDNRNERKSYYSSLTGFRRAVPIIIAALALFIGVCFLTDSTGALGNGVSTVLLGLFSRGAYAIPFLMILHAIFYASDFAKKRTVSRIIFSVIAVLFISALEYTVVFWSQEPPFDPIGFFTTRSAGGFLGSAIAFLLVKILGRIGLIILAATVLAIYFTFFFAGEGNALGRACLIALGFLASALAVIERGIKNAFGAMKSARKRKKIKENEKKNAEFTNDPFFEVSNGMSELQVKQLGIREVKESGEADPVLQTSVFHKSAAPATDGAADGEPKKEEAGDKLSENPPKRPLSPKRAVSSPHANAHRAIPVVPEQKEDADEKAYASESGDSFFAATAASDSRVSVGRKASMGLDESAEAVFTDGFDPYDFMSAEKIAAKRSSRAVVIEEIPAVSELVDELTEDYVQKKKALEAHERRLAEFEEAKRRARGELQDASEVSLDGSAAAVSDETVVSPSAGQANAAEAAHAAKTVAFNLTNEPRRADTAPLESGMFRRTFDKSEQFAEMERSESERAAAHIAEAVAQDAPFYTRSYNETYTRMSVTGSIEEVTASAAAQVSADSAQSFSAPAAVPVQPAAPAQAPESFSAPAAVPVQPAAPAQAPESFSAPAAVPVQPVAPAQAPESFSAPAAAPVQPAAPAQAPFEQTVIAHGTPITASAQDNVIGGRFAEEYAHEVKPEPAAALAEPIVTVYSSSESEANAAPEIKEFTPPAITAVSAPQSDAVTDTSDTLKVEREAVAPSPAVTYNAQEARDSKYTVISGEMALSERSDEGEDDAADEEASGIIWSDSSEGEVAFAPANAVSVDITADATVIDFDSDEEDGEDEAPEAILAEGQDEDDVIEVEIPPEEQNPDVLKKREMFSIFSDPKPQSASIAAAPAPAEITVTISGENNDADKEKDAVEAPAASLISNASAFGNEFNLPDTSDLEDARDAEPDGEDDLPPFDGAVAKVDPPRAAPASAVPASITDLVPADAIKEEKKAAAKPDYSNYVFPDIEMLAIDNNVFDESINAETQENADRLVETLASFNVTASIKGVDRGPRITRYEVVPSKGTKVSSVMRLQEDIALSLAADGIRMEAPIPGKSAIGVEIPNKTSVTVRLRELLETEEFRTARSKTAVCIGKDVAGQPVISDIAKMPHLLIAGATGMGKSVCINSIMVSMLYKAKPDEVKFIMIDPKQVEFTMYNGIPHLLVPVVSEPKQSAGVLMWAVDEMERRYGLLNTLNVRNIDGYNEKVGKDPTLGEALPRIIIVIDEFADLMLQVKDPVENLVMRIAQKARAAGIHLIIGTQRPTTNVITGTIKANIPSRISCKVAGNVDSRTVLDQAGAEKLLNRGDMLFVFSGSIKPLRVQGAFLDDSEVEAVMRFLKESTDGAHYDQDVMEEINRAAQKCAKKNGGDDSDGDEGGSGSGDGYYSDRQFLDAVELAVNTGKISTSLIQRRISVGYGKAAKFIDWMEEIGVVGEANGQKPREVLINADEWQEKLSRVSRDY